MREVGANARADLPHRGVLNQRGQRCVVDEVRENGSLLLTVLPPQIVVRSSECVRQDDISIAPFVPNST